MTAALLNGTFIQGFELDDYHPYGPLHSEACVLPAVLGTAEKIGGIDGKCLLESAALGFEIGPRIGMAMGGLQLVTRGWHFPGYDHSPVPRRSEQVRDWTANP
jgi:aconitate decarboxylase